jgi:hypothetical protein
MNVNYLVMVQDATVDQVRNDKREVLLDNCEIIHCFILSLLYFCLRNSLPNPKK